MIWPKVYMACLKIGTTLSVMKTFRTAAVVLALTTTACSPGTPSRDPGEATKHDRVTLEFSPGHVYEVGALWLRPGREASLQAFVNGAFPIAIDEYGVKPLVSIVPTWASDGDAPDSVFINEWPSRERYDAFTQDPRFVGLLPQREDATTNLFVSVFSVDAPYEITFSPDQHLALLGTGEETPGSDVKDAWVAMLKASGHVPLTHEASDEGDFGPTLAALGVFDDQAAFAAFAQDTQAQRSWGPAMRAIVGPPAS